MREYSATVSDMKLITLSLGAASAALAGLTIAAAPASATTGTEHQTVKNVNDHRDWDDRDGWKDDRYDHHDRRRDWDDRYRWRDGDYRWRHVSYRYYRHDRDCDRWGRHHRHDRDCDRWGRHHHRWDRDCDRRGHNVRNDNRNTNVNYVVNRVVVRR